MHHWFNRVKKVPEKLESAVSPEGTLFLTQDNHKSCVQRGLHCKTGQETISLLLQSLEPCTQTTGSKYGHTLTQSPAAVRQPSQCGLVCP